METAQDVDDATMLTRAKQGLCPECGAGGVEYGLFVLEGAPCQDGACPKCGASWWECYTLESIEPRD